MIKTRNATKPAKSSKSLKLHQKQEEVKPAIRKGELIELLIQGLDNEGRGFAYSGGQLFVVSGTVSGDRCLARVVHIGKTFISAKLVRLLLLSQLRAEKNPCPDADDCMGCPLIQMQYTEQLRWKHELVIKEIRSFNSLNEVQILPALSPAKILGYRTTAKLAVAGSYSDPYIGIYRRASHDVVDLEECPLHHPVINNVINAVRKGITKLKIPIWQDKNRTGILRYLVIRVSEASGEVMLTFVTARRAFNEIHHLSKYIEKELPQVKVVSQNVNNSEGNVIFGHDDHFITKQKTIQERIGNLFFEVSHRSFLQAQNDGARMIYETVADWAALDGRQSVLDLYCGIGGISMSLAPKAARVLGIEINPDAVADARRNARLNNLKNCRFEAGDVSELLDDLLDDGASFDLVSVNPPRKGCDRDIIGKLVALRPGVIIYVSCSPETFARDLDILSSSGYRCLRIQPVDMFPQTPHIENIAFIEAA